MFFVSFFGQRAQTMPASSAPPPAPTSPENLRLVQQGMCQLFITRTQGRSTGPNVSALGPVTSENVETALRERNLTASPQNLQLLADQVNTAIGNVTDDLRIRTYLNSYTVQEKLPNEIKNILIDNSSSYGSTTVIDVISKLNKDIDELTRLDLVDLQPIEGLSEGSSPWTGTTRREKLQTKYGKKPGWSTEDFNKWKYPKIGPLQKKLKALKNYRCYINDEKKIMDKHWSKTNFSDIKVTPLAPANATQTPHPVFPPPKVQVVITNTDPITVAERKRIEAANKKLDDQKSELKSLKVFFGNWEMAKMAKMANKFNTTEANQVRTAYCHIQNMVNDYIKDKNDHGCMSTGLSERNSDTHSQINRYRSITNFIDELTQDLNNNDFKEFAKARPDSIQNFINILNGIKDRLEKQPNTQTNQSKDTSKKLEDTQGKPTKSNSKNNETKYIFSSFLEMLGIQTLLSKASTPSNASSNPHIIQGSLGFENTAPERRKPSDHVTITGPTKYEPKPDLAPPPNPRRPDIDPNDVTKENVIEFFQQIIAQLDEENNRWDNFKDPKKEDQLAKLKLLYYVLGQAPPSELTVERTKRDFDTLKDRWGSFIPRSNVDNFKEGMAQRFKCYLKVASQIDDNSIDSKMLQKIANATNIRQIHSAISSGSGSGSGSSSSSSSSSSSDDSFANFESVPTSQSSNGFSIFSGTTAIVSPAKSPITSHTHSTTSVSSESGSETQSNPEFLKSILNRGQEWLTGASNLWKNLNKAWGPRT